MFLLLLIYRDVLFSGVAVFSCFFVPFLVFCFLCVFPGVVRFLVLCSFSGAVFVSLFFGCSDVFAFS